MFGLRPGVRTTHRGGLYRPSLVQIDFVPSLQPTANLEVSWRNEIASDGIDSHLTGLTLSSQPGRDTGRPGSSVVCSAVQSPQLFSYHFISI